MLCSIMTMVTSRGMARSSLLHVAALVDREAGVRLVEQQHLRVLRQRHGDLDPPPLAVGGLRQRPVGDVPQADPLERVVGAVDQIGVAGRSRVSGFHRAFERPSSASVTLRTMVSRANSVMI